MNELRLIDERKILGKEFKIYGDFENPLFLAKDVANWIEHNKPNELIANLDESEKLKATISLSGQNREVWFITEDGLYEILMLSRKPIAKAFKKEVKKILKSIRKNGMFATDELLDNPDLLIKMATKLKEEKEKIKELEEENAINKQIIAEFEPIKDYVDTILSSEDTMRITQIAADYGLSGKALNKILHDERIIRNVGGQWLLYIEHMNKGYTKSETITVKKKDGTDKVLTNTKWTQKGRLKIHEILTALGIKANLDKENEVA